MTPSLSKLILICIATGAVCNATIAYAAPKQKTEKHDDVPYMTPGVVRAGQVWSPDADGLFRMPGKLLGGRFGFIDKTGKVVIPGQFDKVSIFSDGMCAVQIKDKWGFIDRAGKLAIPAKFNEYSNFGEGLAGVRERGGWYFIDKTGAVKIPETKYFKTGEFHEGLCSVNYDEKWGFIDHSGKEVLPCQYYMEGAPRFNDGMAAVRPDMGKPANMIDKTGKVLPRNVLDRYSGQISKELDDMELAQKFQKQYQRVYPFVDGIAMVKQTDGKCGFIDKTGKVVIQPVYADANSFFEGLASVYIGGRFEKGQVIGKMDPKFKYSSANPAQTLRKLLDKH